MSLPYLPWQRPTEFDARPCVRDDQAALNYREFAERVEAVAEQFAARGVGAGSVVAVMLPNRVELLIAIMAAWRLGAAATPVNPTYTVAEAAHQITDSGAVLLVASASAAVIDGIEVLSVDDLAGVPSGTLPPPATDASDLALLVYTSGSTGRPKGVMLDHSNLEAMVASMNGVVAVNRDDHCLLVLPLFHANAIFVSFLLPMSVGAQLTVLQRFHPVEFLAAVSTFRPTYFSGVPTIYTHLLGVEPDEQIDTSSVRFAICGAAPAPPDLHAAVEERFGFPLVEGYGLSEGTCASTCNPVAGVRKPGTVGPALPGQRVAIMDADGTVLPAGERGEVVIQGPTVMQGYLNQPEATADALGSGWLHTGDVGILDGDGYLRIVNRIKDMIIRGGENIYPKEIENVLHTEPAVLEAAVVGGPHAVYGEVPVAFVAARPGQQIDVDALLARCRENLTKIKVPVTVEVLEALPKNAVGKVDKPTLRALLAPAHAHKEN